LWLKHDNYDVFDFFEVVPGEEMYTTDSGPTRMQFELSKTGEVESIAVDLEASVKPLIFTKQLPHKELAKADLEKYVGEYTLGNTTAKIYIKGDKTLYLFVPGQPEYELAALGSDKFALKAVSGYFVQFSSNDKGLITDVTFMQPNGNFKAVKKTDAK